MRAEIVAGYDRSEEEEYSDEYPLVLIKIIAEALFKFKVLRL